MIVNVPAPETAGSKLEPLTPVPEYTPPLGLPDNTTAELFIHNGPEIAAKLTLGKVLTVVSTSTSTIKKAVSHLLSVTSYGIISIGKALSLKFSVVVTSVATIYGGVYPVFGAIADNTFIAISRIRKIFFTKNNG